MKRRLDVWLVEKGLAETRTRAQALVLEGKVRVNGQVETKAARALDETAEIAVEAPPRFVSRGGEKLEGAFALWGGGGEERPSQDLVGDGSNGGIGDAALPLRRSGTEHSGRGASPMRPQTLSLPPPIPHSPFPIPHSPPPIPHSPFPIPPLSALGKACLDVGSSTGGFTDCLLQHGARRVMAVDVGTNQLAYRLRADPRVWVRENFNARYLTAADLPEQPALAVTDVSFISLRLILPPIRGVLPPGGQVVALIKPQFEVGKGKAPGGLVRDEALRTEARDGIVRFATDELGLRLLGLAESPIRGKEMGNVEYLSWWEVPNAAS